jgi:hypothetical protein
MGVGVTHGQILAHRGIWSEPTEANSPLALTRALEAGFGIETDLRDMAGVLVVSHDPPSINAPGFAQLVLEWKKARLLDGRLLALNVKSDGLLNILDAANPAIANMAHFFFDMSFPELLKYSRAGKPVAVRISEYERCSLDVVRKLGVPERYWLDGFNSDWWLEDPFVDQICRRGQVAIVSPEIHRRDPNAVWEWFAGMVSQGCDLLICTDRPIEILETCS